MAESKQANTMENAVKLVGEVFVPGASLLIDGKILAGGAHLLVGTVARLALGPLGLAIVAANSYSTSATGKGLLKLLGKDPSAQAAQKDQKDQKAAAAKPA